MATASSQRTGRHLTQYKHRIGYWKKSSGDTHKQFVSLTNFAVELLSFIPAPEGLSQSYKGYLVRVTQQKKAGGINEGVCFLPWYKVPSPDQFLDVLSHALPDSVLSCNITPRDMRQFLMDLWHSTEDESSDESDQDKPQLKAVVCMGRQPGSNIYVLGPRLQFYSNGASIPVDQQHYVWVNYLLKKLKIYNQIHPINELPVVRRPLHKAVKGIKKLSGQNVLSALHIVAGAIMSLFYAPLQLRCGSVAITIVYGPVSGGKTNIVRLSLAMCANTDGVVAYLSESSARKKLGSSLPFAFDDPNQSEEKYKSMLIQGFGGASLENDAEKITPRCVPLITANDHIVDALTDDHARYLARVVLVPFVLESGEVTLDQLQKIQSEAVSAFPEVLSIGNFLEHCDPNYIYSLRDEIMGMVGTKFDSRLATQYAFNMACALKIAEEAHVDGITPRDIKKNFADIIAPEILRRQIRRNTEGASIVYTLKQLCTKVKSYKFHKILKVVNPMVRYQSPASLTKKSHSGVAIQLKEFLILCDKMHIDHDDERTIRKSLKSVQRTSYVTRSKQYFLRAGCKDLYITRESGKSNSACKACIIIPREDLPPDLIDTLDKYLPVHSSVSKRGKRPSTKSRSTKTLKKNTSNKTRKSPSTKPLRKNPSTKTRKRPRPLKHTDDSENHELPKEKRVCLCIVPPQKEFITEEEWNRSEYEYGIVPDIYWEEEEECIPCYFSESDYHSESENTGEGSSPLVHSTPKRHRTPQFTTSTGIVRRFSDKGIIYRIYSPGPLSPKKSLNPRKLFSSPKKTTLKITTSNIPEFKESLTEKIKSSSRIITRSKSRSTVKITAKDMHSCQKCFGVWSDGISDPDEWVGCDSCWRWYHCQCIGLKPPVDESVPIQCQFC